MSTNVTVIDYGLGNIFNLQMALNHLGAKVDFAANRAQIQKSNLLILPGVGAFEHGMLNLKERGLVEPILEHCKNGKPILGICLGMQLMTSVSFENGQWEGLGLIDATVTKMCQGLGPDQVKIPHMSWNEITPTTNTKGTILQDIPEGASMYFVHSYMVSIKSQSECLAQSNFGSNYFCSVMRKGNIAGAQFHPERSGKFGLILLENFLAGRI